MPTAVSLQKNDARERLRQMAPLQLHRPIFFVPGWTDQGCLCWTEPYVEGGGARRAGWEYTIQDWVDIRCDPADRTKAHYVKLVEDEADLRIERYTRGSREDQVKSVRWSDDRSYAYENFFQFAELLKTKVREIGASSYDLVGHSMGGLDLIAAVALDQKHDREPEVQQFITSPPLEGVNRVITVATPFRGSPGAKVVKRTSLDEIVQPNWAPGVRKQAEAMSPDSPFIKIITDPKQQQRLVERARDGVHTFGSRNDPATPNAARMIDGATNHEPLKLARHSQIMGITQDPRFAFELFRILME